MLPQKQKEVELEARARCAESDKTVTERFVVAETHAVEYSHVVAMFPTGARGEKEARYLVGKPFSGGYKVSAVPTLRAEPSAAAKADAQTRAKAQESSSSSKKRLATTKKVDAPKYCVGVSDAVLGEETDSNRTIAVVPTESLRTHWVALGGCKRSRAEEAEEAKRPAKKTRRK